MLCDEHTLLFAIEWTLFCFDRTGTASDPLWMYDYKNLRKTLTSSVPTWSHGCVSKGRALAPTGEGLLLQLSPAFA